MKYTNPQILNLPPQLVNTVASIRASSYNYAEVPASQRPRYRAELLRGRFNIVVSPRQRLQETFYRVMLVPGGQHIQ